MVKGEEMKEDKIMYCLPSKFTREEPGTIIKVMGEGDSFSLYVQASPSQESPEWIEWGIFLGIALEDETKDPKFISSCLTKYLLKVKKEL